MTRSQERLGLLFVLVGPGGVGKNTLMRRVLSRVENLQQLPTATTRPPRENEQEGREHLFKTHEQFQELIRTGALLEYQEVRPGHFYGIPRSTIEDAIHNRRDLIADIENYGAEILRKTFPKNTILIFIAPPSLDKLIAQMRDRGDSEQIIADRMKRAEMEMKFAPGCDYVIVNHVVDKATEELYSIVAAEQAGLLAPPMSIKTNFKIMLIPTCNQHILRHAYPPEFLETMLRQDETPEQAALRIIQEVFQIIPRPERLFYGVNSAQVISEPLSIDFKPEQQQYHLTFQFAYEFENLPPAPDGWYWTTDGKKGIVVPPLADHTS